MKYYLTIFTIFLVISISLNCDDKLKKSSNNPNANLESLEPSKKITEKTEVKIFLNN